MIESISGDGRQTVLKAVTRFSEHGSCWIAAHVVAREQNGEPEIQAHTNPLYVLRGGAPVMIQSAREAVVARWESEIAWYKSAGLVFPTETQRREFFDEAERALRELRRPLAH